MAQSKMRAGCSVSGWLFELFSILLSCSCVITLCVVLAVYDGRDMPTFGALTNWGITLNTAVSILATVAVFSAAAAVMSCISQLKWLWFSRSPRSLSDLNAYDEASRGLIGSIRLLWTLRMTPIASLGAFLVIVQLAIAPLAQQSIQSEMRTIASSNVVTSVWTTTGWDESPSVAYADGLPSIRYAVGVGMRSAILSGLFAGSDSRIALATPVCPSDNCTFPDYQSLAVCSSLSDVTSQIKQSSNKCCVTDENCLNITSFGTLANITSATLANPNDPDDNLTNSYNFTSVAFKNRTSPLTDIFLISQTGMVGTASANCTAVEFVFDWCVPTISTKMRDGNATIARLPNSFIGFQPDASNGSISGVVRGTTYSVNLEMHYALQRYLTYLLSGVHGDPTGNGDRADNSDAVQILYSNKHKLDVLLDNLAAGMTNYIQDNSLLATPVRGTVDTQRNIVVIKWGWLAAPITFAFLSVVFFVAVVIQGRHSNTTKPPLWKSSSTAVLRILDPKLRYALGPLKSNSSLDENGAQISVRLVREDDGWSFVQDELGADVRDSIPLVKK